MPPTSRSTNNDIDFCLRLRMRPATATSRTPHARGSTHHEIGHPGRATSDNRPERERAARENRMKTRWAAVAQERDPAYNPI